LASTQQLTRVGFSDVGHNKILLLKD